MELTPVFMLTLFVDALVAGIGWTLGCWITGKLLAGLNRPA